MNHLNTAIPLDTALAALSSLEKVDPTKTNGYRFQRALLARLKNADFGTNVAEAMVLGMQVSLKREGLDDNFISQAATSICTHMVRMRNAYRNDNWKNVDEAMLHFARQFVVHFD